MSISYLGCEIGNLVEYYKQELQTLAQRIAHDPNEPLISLETTLHFIHASKDAVQRCILLLPKELL